MITAKSENSRKVSGCQVMRRSHQHLVEGAVAAKQRNPGDGADDAGCPERHRAEQEEDGARHGVADMEDQELGDVEAQEQGDCPDDDGEFQRAEIDA